MPKASGLIDPTGKPIPTTDWIKGPFPFVPFKKLGKKMRKLEKAFEAAKGPISRARILKGFAACERKIKREAKLAAAIYKQNRGRIVEPTGEPIVLAPGSKAH